MLEQSHFRTLDAEILDAFLPTPAFRARVVAGTLLLRAFVVLGIEVYLVRSIGLVDANLRV